jgi:uncharacterized protein YajQ (UPF0234 family)
MNVLQRIEEQFNNVNQAKNEMKGRIDLLSSQCKIFENTLESSNNHYKIIERVLDILRTYATLKEQVLRSKIDDVITKGLQLIFGDTYKSKLEFGISRGQAVIRPRIVTMINGNEFEADVAKAHGGGLVNIVSALYQIIVLALIKPKQRQILFLDEMCKNISEEYIEATGEFLKYLNEKLGMQLVIITHKKQLHEIADSLYEFSLEDGVTNVRKLK